MRVDGRGEDTGAPDRRTTLLALVLATPGRWAYAAAHPAAGSEIHHGHLDPTGLTGTGPPDLGPVLRRLQGAGSGPHQIALGLQEEPDVDLLAEEIAMQLLGVAQVVGVAVVERVEVLELLGLPIGGDSTAAGDSTFVQRINELCKGDLRPDQVAEAWAVGMLVASSAKPLRSSPMLRLMGAYPSTRNLSTPSQGQVARDVQTDQPAREVSVPLSDDVETTPLTITMPGQVSQPQVSDHRRSTRSALWSVVRSDPAEPTASRGKNRLTDSQELLATADVMSLYGVSRSTAYRLKQHIPFVRLGGIRFRREDIERFLTDQQVDLRTPISPSHRRSGIPLASHPDDEVIPGVSREELIRKAGF